MKILSKLTLQNVVFLAAIACMVVTSSLGAFAVPPIQVHRSLTSVSLTGACCQDVPGETVRVTEPAAVVPVVLTWSMEYNTPSDGAFAVGVRLNGGGCGDYGPSYIPRYIGDATQIFSPHTVAWVIFPSDGLVKGNNTFTVCYGPTRDNNDVLTVGPRTLAVRLSK